MCEGIYTQDEIICMEIDILHTLGWYLNGPTSHDFIELFMMLLPAGANKNIASDLKHKAIQNVEAFLVDYSLALEKPSSLALAAIAKHVKSLDSEKLRALKYSAWMRNIGLIMRAFQRSNRIQDVYGVSSQN